MVRTRACWTIVGGLWFGVTLYSVCEFVLEKWRTRGHGQYCPNFKRQYAFHTRNELLGLHPIAHRGTYKEFRERLETYAVRIKV